VVAHARVVARRGLERALRHVHAVQLSHRRCKKAVGQADTATDVHNAQARGGPKPGAGEMQEVADLALGEELNVEAAERDRLLDGFPVVVLVGVERTHRGISSGRPSGSLTSAVDSSSTSD